MQRAILMNLLALTGCAASALPAQFAGVVAFKAGINKYLEVGLK